jgi:hypothetical protein
MNPGVPDQLRQHSQCHLQRQTNKQTNKQNAEKCRNRELKQISDFTVISVGCGPGRWSNQIWFPSDYFR